jgi:cytochrome c oxidase subunit 3
MSAAHGEQVRILEEHGEEGGRSINWWGMIFFIASEALIFANFIASYLYLEIRSGRWVLPDGQQLNWRFSGVNTLILLASSGTAMLANAGLIKGNRRQMIGWLVGTIILGLTFLSGQLYEYTDLFNGHFTIQTGVFGSAFFTLTGFHGLHVTIGVIFLTIVLIRAIRGDFTAKKHFAFQAGEMYWHFVDLVWVVVYSTVYLLPLLNR